MFSFDLPILSRSLPRKSWTRMNEEGTLMTAPSAEINEVPDLDYGVPLGACRRLQQPGLGLLFWRERERGTSARASSLGSSTSASNTARCHMLTLTGTATGSAFRHSMIAPLR